MKKGLVALIAICMFIFAINVSCASGSEESYGYGYMDRTGTIVIEPQFDYAYAFSGGMGRIFSGKLSTYGSPDEGLYGFIDATGNIVVHPKYDEATDFSNDGYAAVKKNGKYGIINTSGDVVVDFSYDYIQYRQKTNTYDAFIGTVNDWGSPDKGTHYIIKADGTIVFSGDYKYIYAYDGYYEAKKGEKYALLSLDGSEITGYDFDSLTSESEDLIGFKKGSYYGYIDLKGNVIIEAKYDSVGAFIDGKAIVEKNDKYSLIDSAGNVLVSYKADYVSKYPVNGVTYAFDGTLTTYGSPDNGYYYLMDLEGNILSRRYKKGDSYSIADNGYWRVKEGEYWYLVNASGEEEAKVNAEYLYTCGDDLYVAQKNGMDALLDKNLVQLTEFEWDNISTTSSNLIPFQHLAIEPDFRSVRWGMTEEEVRSLEGNKPDYSGKLDGRNAWYIGYDTKLMGNSVILAYYFGANGLYEARYIWTESHSNENLYISDYKDVRTQLTAKYGSPWWDKENWDTSSHKSYYSEKKGDALSYGYLTYETCYRTNRTNITMQMDADNYKVSFIIYYESKTITAPAIDYSRDF